MFIVEVKRMSELRSSYEEAEKESSLMENKGSEIQEHITIPIYQTNLPVVANMQNAMNCLGATNQRYQVLISGNADAIRKLGLEFQQLDQEMAEQMGTDLR